MEAQESRVKQVLSEHEELREASSSLLRFLEHPRPDVQSDEATSWATDLAQRLVSFHDKAVNHFREEENSGFFEDLRRAHPYAARSISELREEHEGILKDLRQVLRATMVYAESKAPRRQNIRRWTRSVLEHMSRHERQETELAQKLIYLDLGCGD